MHEHVVVHQLDPLEPVVGGIDGFIRELVANAPDNHRFSIIGVDSQRRFKRLGQWATVAIDRRVIPFMPLTRVHPASTRRKVPHSARLIAGLLYHRPILGSALIHSHRAEIGVALAAAYPPARKLQFIHGDGVEAAQAGEETFWRLLPQVYERVERYAVRHAAESYVMHSGAASRLRLASRSVTVGENWYDGTTFFPSDTAPGNVRVGWAGRLEPQKDPLLALDVFSWLNRQGVEFSGWIAGAGSLYAAVRREVEERGLGDAVRLLGALEPHALAAELRRTTALLMTSRWEGIPRIAIESIASGVPVVSTDAGDIGSVVKPGVNGFIADPGSTWELARLVKRSAHLPRGRAVAATVAHLERQQVLHRLFERLQTV